MKEINLFLSKLNDMSLMLKKEYLKAKRQKNHIEIELINNKIKTISNIIDLSNYYNKVIKTILSCKTIEQCNTAIKFAIQTENPTLINLAKKYKENLFLNNNYSSLGSTIKTPDGIGFVIYFNCGYDGLNPHLESSIIKVMFDNDHIKEYKYSDLFK